METRQLRYFLKVAEALNFSAASRQLYITQSTLSQQIGRLEDEIGIPLFERTNHGVFLTEAGRSLMPYAQRAVIAADACRDHIHDLKELLTGELNIGVTHSFSAIMQDTLIAFIKAYPGVHLNICYQTMEELMQRLKRRELDFVLAFRPLHADKDIDSRVIFSNRLAAIVSESHPLAKLRSVTLAELEKYELVLPARGLQARNEFEKLISGKDLNPRIKVEVNNVNIILRLLCKASYVSVLSESTVIHIDGLRAVPIAADDNEMDGCIHKLRDAYVKHSAQEFIRMLCQSTSILTNLMLKDILNT